MEHSNRYAALDGLPSRDPTPHPPNPPPGFISALDYTAMGMAVNEVYHPTPSPGMLDAMEVVAAKPTQLTPTPPPPFFHLVSRLQQLKLSNITHSLPWIQVPIIWFPLGTPPWLQQ